MANPFTKTKETLSLPTSIKTHGYTIQKMPIGAYLQAAEKLKTLPEDFLANCFPDKSVQQVLDSLTTIDQKGIVSLATAAFVSAPRYVIKFVAELTGIDAYTLVNDANIGLDGFIDIVTAFVEVNRLGECLTGAKTLMAKLKRLTPSTNLTGFKG